ncbi:MAG: phage protease [Burkholderia gladioli]
MVESGEYRYISPVFGYHPKTGVVESLFNAALTNVPAIDGMSAIAAAALSALPFTSTQDIPMTTLLERLRPLLNLPETSTEADVSAALDTLSAQIGQPVIAAAHFSLADHLATLCRERDTAVAAAAKLPGTPDPAKFVPMEQFSSMQNQVAALSRQIEDGSRAELLEAALSDGRILEPQKVYWDTQPLDALKAYLDVAQPLAALSRTQTGGKPPSGLGGERLTQEQAAVCKRMGLDPTAFAKSVAPEA